MSSPQNQKTVVASRLRAARKQSGLTQAQAAKLLGMQRPTISEIEAGRRNVNADEIVSFAKIYGVSSAWILDDENEASPALQLAARELAKLKADDLDKVLNLLSTLREESEDS